jgi:hypothetical protein
MNFFLQLKHWQLFVILIGIPIALEFFTIGFIFSTDDFSSGLQLFLRLFPILMLLYIGVLFGWLWSVGVFLSKKLPIDATMPNGLFKGAIIIPTLYITFICWFVAKLMWGDEMSELFLDENLTVILTAHFTSMACIFYIFYYNAKALQSVELQRPALLSEYVGEFFLFWFFPVGLWFLQPRINKLLEESGTEGGDFV